MLVLQKYGGSSVANAEKIRACARRSTELASAGNQVVVVVSAMQGETNRLIALANELLDPNQSTNTRGPYVAAAKRSPALDRELDQLVATGEQVSASLFAMAVYEQGGRAVSLAGHQLGLQTDRNFTRAKIKQIEHKRISNELAAGNIVVCAGFQGTDPHGDITTLGRGGSDTSAVALAAALGAETCEILTDVDGVYTTDPRIVPCAHKIDKISYDEMLELASLGAKVLQIRSVAFAKKYAVRVHVRSSLNRNPGTLIVPADEVETNMEAIEVSGVALQRDEAKITLVGVPDVPGTIAKVFGALGRAEVTVDMIIQNASRAGRTDVTFTVPLSDLDQARAVLGELKFGERRSDSDGRSQPLGVETDEHICKISVVGLGLRSHAELAARAFEALAAEGINVQMVSNSEIKMSIVVDERYGELALRALHTCFGLDVEHADA